MLPARADTKPSLADVFPSCLAAIRGEENRLRLSPVRTAIVLLVDGLGAAALAARAGHARTLLAASTTIQSGFPTTTASALATLTTGTAPGQHGLVGYSVLDAAKNRVINQLSGWDGLDPLSWQPQPTYFERAADAGIGATVIAPARYRDSPFSRAVLRGATFVAAETIAERLAVACTLSGLVYAYVPELDKLAHQFGVESPQWTVALESLDAQVSALRLPADVGMLVTADHGVIDVAPHNHILFDTVPELMAGVAHVGGEPRCLQLYLEPGADLDALAAAWHASEDARSWVATRAEAIAAGWFGDVRPEVMNRIGDLLIAARKGVAYYRSTASERSRAMVGQHGSWSPGELNVPLIRLGAF
jgi:hypothetical protein